MRILFVSTAGNYAGWKIYGSGMTGYDPDSGDGWFSNYRDSMDSNLGQEWLINRIRTPDYSAGTINWASIMAIEIHCNLTQVGAFGTWGNSMYLKWLMLRDAPVCTGTSDFAELYYNIYWDGPDEWTSNVRWRRNFSRVGYQFYGLAGLSYSPKMEFKIGNGTTATTFTATDFAMGFWNLYDDAGYQTLGPQIQLDALKDRNVDINQSASDVVNFTGGNWSTSSGWSVNVLGSTSGTVNFIRNSFLRAKKIEANHGSFTDCVFNTCQLVSIVPSVTLTGAIIRNAPTGATGLLFTGIPGDYSAVTATMTDNTTYDLVIDPSSAGTFNFSGIKSSGTVKIRNASATLAITVIVGAGITTSTSTAGGAITIQAPQTDFIVNGIVAGSRLLLRRTDTQDILVNALIAGTASTYTYSYSGAIPIEVVLRKATGSPAYKQWRATTTLTATNYTLTASQELDE
jgi:hypothetical protein